MNAAKTHSYESIRPASCQDDILPTRQVEVRRASGFTLRAAREGSEHGAVARKEGVGARFKVLRETLEVLYRRQHPGEAGNPWGQAEVAHRMGARSGSSLSKLERDHRVPGDALLTRLAGACFVSYETMKAYLEGDDAVQITDLLEVIRAPQKTPLFSSPPVGVKKHRP